jgi:PAS domain S-box-containing protein
MSARPVPKPAPDDAGRINAELRRRVSQLTTALDLEGMAAWTWQRKSGRVVVDYQGAGWGVDRLKAPTMKEFFELIVDEDRAGVQREVDRALAQDAVVRFEFRVRRPSGEVCWFGSAVRRFLDDDGSPAGLVGATRDITARKHFYDDLAASEGRLRDILEAEPECVKVVDGAGKLRLMNPAGLRMIEADDAEAALGRPALELVVPAHRDAFRSLHERVMAGGSGVLEYEIEGMKGRRLWVESHVAPLRDAQGRVVAALAITRDVSELRMLASAIIDATNREQERIGHDLHDGVGQELTGIALMLKGLQGQLHKPTAEIRRDVTEILELVNSAIRSTRSLAHGLSPVTLERGGLPLALATLLQQTREASGLRIRFDRRGWQAGRLDLSLALHLYRIAQESLNNIVRHAAARQVTVTLSMSEQRVAVLRIADDGKGLAPDSPAGGLGLRIMGYRARMIGAQLQVTARRGGGTVVTVTCPNARTAVRA